MIRNFAEPGREQLVARVARRTPSAAPASARRPREAASAKHARDSGASSRCAGLAASATHARWLTGHREARARVGELHFLLRILRHDVGEERRHALVVDDRSAPARTVCRGPCGVGGSSSRSFLSTMSFLPCLHAHGRELLSRLLHVPHAHAVDLGRDRGQRVLGAVACRSNVVAPALSDGKLRSKPP